MPVDPKDGPNPADDVIDTPAEKLRRFITRLRIPLAIIGVFAVIGILDDRRAFLQGVPVAFFGELLQIWASSHLYRKERRFTTSGPYAYVRNCMYIGRFFVLLGFFIMTGSSLLVALYVVCYVIYAHIRVKREERFLVNLFGEPYEHYCTEVRAWLPRLTPYSRAESRPARWEQVRVNNEHLNLIMLAAVVVLIFLRIEMLPHDLLNF